MDEKQDRQFTKKGEPMSNFKSLLSKEEATTQGSRFLVLRNRIRLRIIELLSRHGGRICVVEIAEVLNEHPATISGHLAVLRAVRLVTREQYGIFAYYTLNKEGLDKYRELLDQITAL